jgi:hypothetical protein
MTKIQSLVNIKLYKCCLDSAFANYFTLKAMLKLFSVEGIKVINNYGKITTKWPGSKIRHLKSVFFLIQSNISGSETFIIDSL